MVVATLMSVDESKSHKKTRRGGKKNSKKSATVGPLSSGSQLLAAEREDEVMSLEPVEPTEDDQVMINVENIQDPSDAPAFPPMKPVKSSSSSSEVRRIPIPPHRMTPLKRDWINIFSPLTEMCGLQVRMNVPRRQVEIKVCSFVRLISFVFR
jgi:RNA-binding protein PNO1